MAAPEAANNSASTGAMLPMVTLGIPGSPTTAVLLGGMVIWGLQPGPRLFTDQPDFVWPLVGSFYISNLIAVLVNLAFIPLFLWMLRMPFTILAPIIFTLSVVGGYAATQDMHDVWLMLMFGVGAFLLRILDYPLAPAVSRHRARPDRRAHLAPVAAALLRRSHDLPEPADRRPHHGHRADPHLPAGLQAAARPDETQSGRQSGGVGLGG